MCRLSTHIDNISLGGQSYPKYGSQSYPKIAARFGHLGQNLATCAFLLKNLVSKPSGTGFLHFLGFYMLQINIRSNKSP